MNLEPAVFRSFGLSALLLLLAPQGELCAQFKYKTEDHRIVITRYTGESGKVVIPAVIEDLPVTTIGEFAFHECNEVRSVSIPNSVTNIETFAFGKCAGLTRIDIPGSVTAIENGAFEFCDSLKKITIPKSVTHLGNALFSACFSLSEITVEPGNPNYSSANGVLFNENQTVLIAFPPGKSGTFVVPGTVVTISDKALWNCPKMSRLTLSNGMTTLPSKAFAECAGLTAVTIPASVASIGDWAFESCVQLRKVYFLGDAPTLGKPIFLEDDDATVYYMPQAKGWGPSFAGRPTKVWKP